MINRAEAGSRRRRCPFSACLWARPARSPRSQRASRRSCHWGRPGRRSPERAFAARPQPGVRAAAACGAMAARRPGLVASPPRGLPAYASVGGGPGGTQAQAHFLEAE